MSDARIVNVPPFKPEIERAFRALGEAPGIKRLTGAKGSQVANWKRRGFPLRFYRVISDALERAGTKPDDAIWAVEMPSMTERPF